MLKTTASYILYFLITIVTVSTGAFAGSTVESSWAPARKDLEVMSLRSAILVNGVVVIAIAALVYLIVKAFAA